MDRLPLDMAVEIENHIQYGNIPPLNQLPTSAVIGYITVKEFKDRTDSVWDGGPEQIKWVLDDAYLFDEPIYSSAGKLNLFDFPLDENNLPSAHQIDIRYPEYEDGFLSIPVSAELFERIVNHNNLDSYTLDLTDSLLELLSDEDEEPKPVNTVQFESPSGDLCTFAASEPLFECPTQEGTDQPVKEVTPYGEETVYIVWSVLFNPESKDVLRIPHTIKEALAEMDRHITDEQKGRMLSMDKDDFLSEQHFGLCMWVRNAFRLWTNEGLCNEVNELLPDNREMKALGLIFPSDPDDISGYLVELYYDYCHQSQGDRNQTTPNFWSQERIEA